MSINYIDGNVLNHKSDKTVIIIHVNNDAGGWGSGFVVPLGNKYPLAEQSYHNWCYNGVTMSEYSGGNIPFTLGRVQLVKVEDNVYVGNMIAQSQPGGCRIKIGDETVYVRPLRLESLKECLLRVASAAKSLNAEVIGPMFGSALAGGNWDEEIVPLIEECLIAYDIPVTIYRFK